MSHINFPEYTHLPAIPFSEASIEILKSYVDVYYESCQDRDSLDSMEATILKIAPLAFTILTATLLSPLTSVVFWASSWILPNVITLGATMCTGAVLHDTINHIWDNLDAGDAEGDLNTTDTLNKAFTIGVHASCRLAISGKDFIQSSSKAMTSWATTIAATLAAPSEE